MPKATPTITTPAPGAVPGPTLPSILELGRLYVAADKEAIRADEDRDRLPPFDEKRALGLLWERKDAIADLVMTLRPASVADVLVQLGMGVRQLWDLDHVERTQDDQMEALTRIRYAMSGALPVLARECGLDLAEVCEQDVVEVSTCAFPTVPEVAAALADGDDAELLEACEEFFEADARMRPRDPAGRRGDAEVNAQLDAWMKALEWVTSLQATTAAGKTAKARVALLAMESVEASEHQREEQCALSALRDLVGEANGCVVPVEAYEALERGARLLRDRAERLNRGLKGIASRERPA